VAQLVCASCGATGDFAPAAAGLSVKCPNCAGSGSIPPKGDTFGKYTLTGELGRGSMGVVHDAQDNTLHRRVAVKIMHAKRGDEPKEAVTDWQRFIQEARLTANVAKHANIVTVYEAAVHNSRRYIAMEFVAGEPLNRWRQGRSMREQVRILRDVAQAVHHAHEHGIIHRDLKPGNVLVGKGGVPVVTDFGLATYESRKGVTSSSLTPTGYAVGSPAYMSPEQARGQKDLGRATDVYSLGIMLYEAIAGKPPIDGKNPVETLSRVVEGVKVPPSQSTSVASGDPELDAIVMKAIAREPGDRFTTAAELARALTWWLDRGAPRPARSLRPGLFAAAASAALLAIAGMYVLQTRAQKRADEREQKILAELDDTRRKFEAMKSAPPSSMTLIVPLENFKPRVPSAYNEANPSKISFFTNAVFESPLKVTDAGDYDVLLTASGTEAHGELPKFRVSIDDAVVADFILTTGKPEVYRLTVHLSTEPHRVAIEFTNDLYVKETREHRNLFIHDLSLRKK